MKWQSQILHCFETSDQGSDSAAVYIVKLASEYLGMVLGLTAKYCLFNYALWY